MIFLQGQTKGRPFSGGGILNSPTTRGHFSDVQETELPRTPVNSHGLPSRSLHCPVGHAVPRDPPVWSTVMAWVTLGLGVLRLAVAKGKLNLGVPQSFICLEHWNAPTNRSYQKDHVCAQITGCRKPGPWDSLSHSSQALQAARAEASPGCPAACALQHWAEPPSTQLWPGSRACCLWAPWGRSCRVGTSTPAGLPPGETSWGASALPPVLVMPPTLCRGTSICPSAAYVYSWESGRETRFLQQHDLPRSSPWSASGEQLAMKSRQTVVSGSGAWGEGLGDRQVHLLLTQSKLFPRFPDELWDTWVCKLNHIWRCGSQLGDVNWDDIAAIPLGSPALMPVSLTA